MRSARCNAALFEDWHDLQAIARPEVTPTVEIFRAAFVMNVRLPL